MACYSDRFEIGRKKTLKLWLVTCRSVDLDMLNPTAQMISPEQSIIPQYGKDLRYVRTCSCDQYNVSVFLVRSELQVVLDTCSWATNSIMYRSHLEASNWCLLHRIELVVPPELACFMLSLSLCWSFTCSHGSIHQHSLKFLSFMNWVYRSCSEFRGGEISQYSQVK